MIEALGILLTGLCFVSLIYFAKESDMAILGSFKRGEVDQQEGVESGREDYLTQAELQQLTKIISEVINSKERDRDHRISTAKHYKESAPDFFREVIEDYYHYAESISKRINKLAKLQYKLKHKLKTKG